MTFLGPRGGFAAGMSLACAVAVMLVSSVASAQDVSPLDVAERTRLSEGRLVVRSTTQSRGPLDLVGGVSYQVIDASPDEVWDALNDTSEWRRMLPQVSESRQVAATGNERTVLIEQSQGPVSVSYYLRATYASSSHDLTFALDMDRPHDIDAAWGFMTVRPYGDGQSILCYGAMVDIGDGLLTSMVRGTMHEWLLRVPSTIKRYVENRRRDRYASRT